jgi:hypothetical protein
MSLTFSMIPGSWQESIRVSGSIEDFRRVPVKPIIEFQPHWRCRWCAVPTWPVVLDTGAFYDCIVDEDAEGAFADATRPHHCRDGARQ